MSEETITFYRFISNIGELREGGTLITDSDEVAFWRKRFIWMEWLSKMDDWPLELVCIGSQTAMRPFYNDYDADRLAKLRQHLIKIVDKCAWRQDRQLLAEEDFNSYNEMQAAL